MRSLPITFLSPDDDPGFVEALDPDMDWQQFGYGVRVWVVQTCLRLKKAGHPVRMSRSMPEAGIVVVHADTAVYRAMPGPDVVLVVVRSDKARQTYADFEVVQNSWSADGRRSFHVQHWPQPGLIPRKSSRGDQIKHVEFKGHLVSLNTAFSSRQWLDGLLQRGLDWRVDAVDYQGHRPESYSACHWNDYSETDVSLAVRREWKSAHVEKPASKLINAWLAGTPAILGPDQAFRELRRSGDDYIEVRSIDDALHALDAIRLPGRFRAMIENGRARAKEHGIDRVVESWAELLFERIPRELASRTSGERKALRHLRTLEFHAERRWKHARTRVQSLGRRFSPWLV